ncbi:MAG: hypothetical protein IKV46_02340 [Bacteroidales bacterium]|nr:hypothetical protein [Bacteroidales bacterium]
MKKAFLILLFFFTYETIIAQGPPSPPTQHGENTESPYLKRGVFNNKTGEFEPYNTQTPIDTASYFLLLMSSLYVILKIKKKNSMNY